MGSNLCLGKTSHKENPIRHPIKGDEYNATEYAEINEDPAQEKSQR